MVTAKKVVRRRPPEDWRKALDNILRKKRHVKLILLHTCNKNDAFAVNPELIIEIGNTLEDQDNHRPEDEVRILQSRISGAHEILLYLASRPFKVGDLVKFWGLTRVTVLNGVYTRIRATESSSISGFQVTLGPAANELVIHNYSQTFTILPLGNETGNVFTPEHLTKCGFVACCGGLDGESGGEDGGGGKGGKIDTMESMEEILLMIVRAGIGTIFDPTGAVSMGGSEAIG